MFTQLEEKNDKRLNSYRILYNYCRERNYQIYNKSDPLHWIIKRDNVELAETKYLKTKVELNIPDKGILIQLTSQIENILDAIFLQNNNREQ